MSDVYIKRAYARALSSERLANQLAFWRTSEDAQAARFAADELAAIDWQSARASGVVWMLIDLAVVLGDNRVVRTPPAPPAVMVDVYSSDACGTTGRAPAEYNPGVLELEVRSILEGGDALPHVWDPVVVLLRQLGVSSCGLDAAPLEIFVDDERVT